MVTSVQVDEEVRRRLIRVTSELAKERGRRVSYDEAIAYLLDLWEGRRGSRREFLGLYGCIKAERAEVDLAELRRLEERRLARLVSKDSRGHRAPG